jgi:hypothetical protein
MTTADLAFNRRVIWRGLKARIVDIQWRVDRTQVQIRVTGGRTHWTTPAEERAGGIMSDTIIIRLGEPRPCCMLLARFRCCGEMATQAQATRVKEGGSYHIKPYCDRCLKELGLVVAAKEHA